MGPLRGDGNYIFLSIQTNRIPKVEKMGPLRGDGNFSIVYGTNQVFCREDGSPSWGRKRIMYYSLYYNCSREDGSPSWGRKLFHHLSKVSRIQL